MASTPIISITQADFDAKLKEVTDYEAKAAAGREWLRAAEVLMNKKIGDGGGVRWAVGGGGGGSFAAGGSSSRSFTLVPKDDLTAAIEKMATLSAAPITKSSLKEYLRAQGFAEDRLGNYFYTAIMRLKRRNRIQVLEDGTIWGPTRGPKTKEAPG